jgi:hypothetical protein
MFKESNNIKDFPHFKKLDKSQFYPIYKSFISSVKAALDLLKIDKSKVYVIDPTDSDSPIRNRNGFLLFLDIEIPAV